jgi:hypothetical protein
VERAVEVWNPLQRSLQRYEPDFEPLNWEDDQWSSLDFPEGSNVGSETNPNMLDESLLTVFPRLKVVKENRFPLTYVVQLRRCRPEQAVNLQGVKGSSTGRIPPSVQQLDDTLPPVYWLLLPFLV